MSSTILSEKLGRLVSLSRATHNNYIDVVSSSSIADINHRMMEAPSSGG
jgi:hypothetical protein